MSAHRDRVEVEPAPHLRVELRQVVDGVAHILNRRGPAAAPPGAAVFDVPHGDIERGDVLGELAHVVQALLL